MVLFKQINVTSGGSSYTSEPTVTLSSGSGGVAQAVVQNGRIISIAIISAGSGYTTAPEVTIQGEGFGAVARAVLILMVKRQVELLVSKLSIEVLVMFKELLLSILNSVGQGATFNANVFQWTYNLQRTTTLMLHKVLYLMDIIINMVVNMLTFQIHKDLRYILGDNLFENNQGTNH